MTLIISARLGAFVTHVSDCRVSLRSRVSTSVHSDIENKAIILWANDGMALLGYTGHAYVGDLTTDEWLANAITGMDTRDTLAYIGVGYIHCRNFGDIFYKLQKEIEKVARRILNFHLEVMVSGFKRRDRYLCSFAQVLGYAAGQSVRHTPQRPPRTCLESRSLNFRMMGDPPSAEFVKSRLTELLPSYPRTAQQFAQAMRAIVRERSNEAEGVGFNTMSICMDARQKTIIHEVDLGADSDRHRYPPLTPWICGRTLLFAPSNGVGETVTVDGWQITSTSDRPRPPTGGPAFELALAQRKQRPA